MKSIFIPSPWEYTQWLILVTWWTQLGLWTQSSWVWSWFLPQTNEMMHKCFVLSEPSFLINKMERSVPTSRVVRIKPRSAECSVEMVSLLHVTWKKHEQNLIRKDMWRAGIIFLFFFMFILNHHLKFFSFFDDWRRPSVYHVTPKEVLLSFWLFVVALAWACPSDSTQDHLQTFLRLNQPMVSVPSCTALPFPSDHWWPHCKGASWIGEWVWSSNKPTWRSSDSVGVV